LQQKLLEDQQRLQELMMQIQQRYPMHQMQGPQGIGAMPMRSGNVVGAGPRNVTGRVGGMSVPGRVMRTERKEMGNSSVTRNVSQPVLPPKQSGGGGGKTTVVRKQSPAPEGTYRNSQGVLVAKPKEKAQGQQGGNEWTGPGAVRIQTETPQPKSQLPQGGQAADPATNMLLAQQQQQQGQQGQGQMSMYEQQLADFQKAQDEAKEANEKRYLDILESYNTGVNRKDYEERYDAGMKMLKGLGQSAASDIGRQWGNTATQMQGDLVNRGLA